MTALQAARSIDGICDAVELKRLRGIQARERAAYRKGMADGRRGLWRPRSCRAANLRAAYIRGNDKARGF